MLLLLLARRQLRSHGARTALTAAGIACGVALVVAIEVINASTLGAFTDAIEDLAGTAALQVLRARSALPRSGRGRPARPAGHRARGPVLTDTLFVVDGPAAGEALSVFATDLGDGHAVRTLRLVRSATAWSTTRSRSSSTRRASSSPTSSRSGRRAPGYEAEPPFAAGIRMFRCAASSRPAASGARSAATSC